MRNRIRALYPDKRPSKPLEPPLTGQLLDMLDTHDPLAKQFRLARDRLAENGDEEFIIRIIGASVGDPVQYNLPTYPLLFVWFIPVSLQVVRTPV